MPDLETKLEERSELVRTGVNELVKQAAVDTFANVSYGIVVGAAINYYKSGLQGWGIVTSRTSATVVNALTGGLYGGWVNFLYRITNTKEKSNELKNKLKKGIVDIIALNTFQVPIYAASVALADLVHKGHVEWDGVKHGSEFLAKISPLIGPTLNLYMIGLRRSFGLKSTAEKAQQEVRGK